MCFPAVPPTPKLQRFRVFMWPEFWHPPPPPVLVSTVYDMNKDCDLLGFEAHGTAYKPNSPQFNQEPKTTSHNCL